MRNKLLFVIFILLLFSNSPTSTDFLSEEAQTINVAKKLIKATVKIEYGDIITGGPQGTGFYITPNTIITAEHVIRKAPSGQVKFTRKDGTTCTGTIGYREEGVTDLAIITADCTGTPLILATSA